MQSLLALPKGNPILCVAATFQVGVLFAKLPTCTRLNWARWKRYPPGLNFMRFIRHSENTPVLSHIQIVSAVQPIYSAHFNFIIPQVCQVHPLVGEVSSQLFEASQNWIQFCCCLSNRLRRELKAQHRSICLQWQLRVTSAPNKHIYISKTGVDRCERDITFWSLCCEFWGKVRLVVTDTGNTGCLTEGQDLLTLTYVIHMIERF